MAIRSPSACPFLNFRPLAVRRGAGAGLQKCRRCADYPKIRASVRCPATGLGPLVPRPAAPRDRFGDMPCGFVAAAMREPDVAWVTLKPGQPPALVRRLTGTRLEVLAVIADETHYEAKWDFYGFLTRAVASYVERAGSLTVFDT